MQEEEKAVAVLQADRSVSFLTEVLGLRAPVCLLEALQNQQTAVHIKYLITQASACGQIRGRTCPDVTLLLTLTQVFPGFPKMGHRAQETGKKGETWSYNATRSL